jgi:hypothetical protein
LPDILDYTWSQFVAFSEAVARRRQRRAQDLFGLILIGSRGNEDAVAALLKQLGA